MAEITIYIGGSTSDDCDLNIEWFDRNGIHATQHLCLSVDPTGDALVIMLDGRVIANIYSNGQRVFA